MYSVFNGHSLHRTFKTALAAVIMSSTSLTPLRVMAGDLPTDGHVTHGEADVIKSGAELLIKQSTKNAIINWKGFSIGKDNKVHFNNGRGATLNRVTGSDISALDGYLGATGDLFLINENGIVIGKDGVVETGGKFVASTLDIDDADFLDGGDMTFSGNGDGVVINQGKIGSLGGDVAIIARHILNEGTINAENGTVGLAVGREVLLHDADLDGGKFLVKVGDADSSITEAGLINAASAELRANGGNIYALAGNKGSAINATGVSKSGGRVFLTAGGGKVRVAKKVSAKRKNSGKESGGDIFINADVVNIGGLLDASGFSGQGGNIDIGGDEIALASAAINVDGAAGGGRIRIGGADQGGDFGDMTTASKTTIDADSKLTANATDSGDGGEIVVWSNDTTTFDGHIEAKGGANGGNGGDVETSGKNVLTVGKDAFVSTLASMGSTGNWLLDPADYTIATSGGDATGSDVENWLLTNNVTIMSSMGTVVTNGSGNIYVNDDISWSGSNSLTLEAANDVIVNSSILATNGDVAMTGNAVVIGDGTQSAGIAVGSAAGTTSIDATSLSMTGGSASGAYAQLGYRGAASGDIDVQLTGDLTMTGGAASGANAQIGHGAVDGSVSDDISGNINLVAGGMTTLTDNSARAWLGHKTSGTLSSANFFLVSEGMDFSGTDGLAPMVLNNIEGGDVSIVNTLAQTDANEYDKIIYDYTGGPYLSRWVDTDNALTFVSRGGILFNYSYQAYGDGADINLISGWDGSTGLTTGIDVGVIEQASAFGTSSVADQGDVNIGDGTQSNSVSVGTRTGDITVLAHDLEVLGGDSHSAYAQLGARPYIDEIDSDIRVVAMDDVRVYGGSKDNSYAQIGHGTIESSEIIKGGIEVTAAEDIDLEAGDGFAASARIGHVDLGSFHSTLSGAITLDGTDIYVWGGGDFSVAQIGHGGEGNLDGVSAGTRSGAISITGETLDMEGGAGELSFAKIGHGGLYLDGESSGKINIDIVDYAAVLGGTGSAAFAQIGHGAPDTADDASGEITINSRELVAAADGEAAYVQIGHGGPASSATLSGKIDITTDWMGLFGGYNVDSFVQVGHGGFGGSGFADGEIDINAYALIARGGDGEESYAQIGHAGPDSDFDAMGAINLDTQIALLSGGDGDNSHAQIGHGGRDAEGDADGDINLTTSYLNLSGGDGAGTYAQIGHGDGEFTSSGTRKGNVDIRSANLSLLTANNGGFWLGHATKDVDGLSYANVAVTSGGYSVVGGDISSNIVYALGGGNVTLLNRLSQSSAIGFDDIVLDGSALSAFDSANTLTLAARGDVTIGSNFANTGSGNLNAIAGWDGAKGLDQTGFTALDVDALIQAGAYGDMGSTSFEGSFYAGGTSKIAGADVSFASTIDGPQSLYTYGMSGVYFEGAIGASEALRSLTTGPFGTTYINGGSVTAFGNSQTYNNAVVLGADTVLTETGGGDVSFNGTVNGAHKLTVNTSGVTRFSGAVGESSALSTLTTNSGGTTVLGAGTINTTGNQTYGDQIVVVSDNKLKAKNGNITFDGGMVSNAQTDVDFQAIAGGDIVLGDVMSLGSGNGDIVLAAGGNFHNDSGSTLPFVTNGRWLAYSTRPDHNRNDIKISDWDFLRYSTSFDESDPIPSNFASGNGLIYSVTPIITLTASDEIINYGSYPAPKLTRTIKVNGAAVNAAAFGFSVDPLAGSFYLASNVSLDANGNPNIGFYANGLVPGGFAQNYYGVITNTNEGDLTVNLATSNPDLPDTPDLNSRVQFGPCSPSEDDLDAKPYDENTGELCTLLPQDG